MQALIRTEFLPTLGDLHGTPCHSAASEAQRGLFFPLMLPKPPPLQ
jgi:hypothetical protein